LKRVEVEGGISGAAALDLRPDIQRMFQLLAAGKIDEVRWLGAG